MTYMVLRYDRKRKYMGCSREIQIRIYVLRIFRNMFDSRTLASQTYGDSSFSNLGVT